MGKQYTAKSFKSGNSVAIRVPAALGIVPGQEWLLTEEDGTLVFRTKPAEKPRIDVSGFWGKEPGLIPPPRLDFEERPSTLARRKAKAAQSE